MIDLDALESMAEDIDQLADDDRGTINNNGRKKKKKPSLKDLREPEDQPEESIQPFVYDPEFEIMITSLVGDVVEKCQEGMQWSEPGIHWRQKVGGCVARIVQKRITKGRQIADELVLLGYLALWIGPNVKIPFGPRNGGSESPDTLGNNGQR